MLQRREVKGREGNPVKKLTKAVLATREASNRQRLSNPTGRSHIRAPELRRGKSYEERKRKKGQSNHAPQLNHAISGRRGEGAPNRQLQLETSKVIKATESRRRWNANHSPSNTLGVMLQKK